jgi:hypothetical protein
MSNNIGTRWVKDLCAFVDACNLEDVLDQLVLVIVFVFVEGWESSVIILRAFEPSVGSVDFLGVGSKGVISGHFLVHDTVQKQEHGSVINVRCVLKFLSIRDTTIGLDRGVDHELDSGMELFDVFSCFQKGQRGQQRIPIPSIIKTALIRHSSIKVHILNKIYGLHVVLIVILDHFLIAVP